MDGMGIPTPIWVLCQIDFTQNPPQTPVDKSCTYLGIQQDSHHAHASVLCRCEQGRHLTISHQLRMCRSFQQEILGVLSFSFGDGKTRRMMIQWSLKLMGSQVTGGDWRSKRTKTLLWEGPMIRRSVKKNKTKCRQNKSIWWLIVLCN